MGKFADLLRRILPDKKKPITETNEEYISDNLIEPEQNMIDEIVNNLEQPVEKPIEQVPLLKKINFANINPISLTLSEILNKTNIDTEYDFIIEKLKELIENPNLNLSDIKIFKNFINQTIESEKKILDDYNKSNEKLQSVKTVYEFIENLLSDIKKYNTKSINSIKPTYENYLENETLASFYILENIQDQIVKNVSDFSLSTQIKEQLEESYTNTNILKEKIESVKKQVDEFNKTAERLKIDITNYATMLKKVNAMPPPSGQQYQPELQKIRNELTERKDTFESDEKKINLYLEAIDKATIIVINQFKEISPFVENEIQNVLEEVKKMITKDLGNEISQNIINIKSLNIKKIEELFDSINECEEIYKFFTK